MLNTKTEKSTNKRASKLAILHKQNIGSKNYRKPLTITMYFSRKPQTYKNSTCRPETACSYHRRHNQMVAVQQNITTAQNNNVGVARHGARRTTQYKHTFGTATHKQQIPLPKSNTVTKWLMLQWQQGTLLMKEPVLLWRRCLYLLGTGPVDQSSSLNRVSWQPQVMCMTISSQGMRRSRQVQMTSERMTCRPTQTLRRQP